MPYFIKKPDGYLLNAESGIEAVIIPNKTSLLSSYSVLGTTLLNEAGDKLSDILITKTCRNGQSLITKSFDLEATKGIKFLFHIPTPLPEDDNPEEIQKWLTLYYRNGLAAAAKRKVKAVLIPITGDWYIDYSVMAAIKTAIIEIEEFLTNNSSIEIHVLIENETTFQIYQDLYGTLTNSPDAIDESISPSLSVVSGLQKDELAESKENEYNNIPLEMINQSFRNTLSPELVGWHDLSLENILHAVQNDSKDDLRFFTGPDLYAIRSKYERGDLGLLQWQYYKKYWHILVITATVAALENVIEFVKCKFIIFTEGSSFTLPSKILSTDIDKYKYVRERFSTANIRDLDTFIKWKKTIKLNEIDVINTLKSDVKDEDVFQIVFENSEEISNLINMQLKKFNCRQNTENFTIPSAIHDNLVTEYKKVMSASFNKMANIRNVINALNKAAEIMREKCEVVSVALSEAQSEMKTAQINMSASFKSFAKDWMNNNEKYTLLKPLIVGHTIHTEKNREEILSDIEKYNRIATVSSPGISLINKYFESCSDTDLQRTLDQRFLTKDLQNILLLAYATHSINLTSDEAGVVFEEVWTPMPSWSDLSRLLSYIDCKSEIQQIVKTNLEHYIDSKNTEFYIPSIISIFFNDKELKKKKMHVSYLISCLLLASAFSMDEGILYHKTSYPGKLNSSHVVGLNFSLERGHFKSSDLKIVLEKILEKIETTSYLTFQNKAPETFFDEKFDPVFVFNNSLKQKQTGFLCTQYIPKGKICRTDLKVHATSAHVQSNESIRLGKSAEQLGRVGIYTPSSQAPQVHANQPITLIRRVA